MIYSWFTNFLELFSANNSKTTQHTVMQFYSGYSYRNPHKAMLSRCEDICQKRLRKNIERTVVYFHMGNYTSRQGTLSI